MRSSDGVSTKSFYASMIKNKARIGPKSSSKGGDDKSSSAASAQRKPNPYEIALNRFQAIEEDS